MNLTGQPVRPKGKPLKPNKVLRDSAAKQECTLREPGVCLHDAETVIFAHYRRFGVAGMGQKPPELIGANMCAACHDFQEKHGAGDGELLRAMIETLINRWQAGLIRLPGE
jgi:hypothetical protein